MVPKIITADAERFLLWLWLCVRLYCIHKKCYSDHFCLSQNNEYKGISSIDFRTHSNVMLNNNVLLNFNANFTRNMFPFLYLFAKNVFSSIHWHGNLYQCKRHILRWSKFLAASLNSVHSLRFFIYDWFY